MGTIDADELMEHVDKDRLAPTADTDAMSFTELKARVANLEEQVAQMKREIKELSSTMWPQ